MTERELFLRRFHAAHPGATSHALARTGSYARFAARIPRDARVLDLACGDGPLLAHLPPTAIGLDLSREELGDLPRVVQGRAQALPFVDGAFEVVTCHLAFMLFDDVARVVTELARVLASGGRFIALLGGGPTAHGHDAFHHFLDLLAPHAVAALRFGDPRATSESGWRELFAGWHAPTFERWELDASGTLDEVWAFLGASYQLPARQAPAIRAQLADAFPGPRVPCRIVTWYAEIRR
ncbi:MAG: class I SAM-dependent methyltransferase [Kofleriaceae bacterium]|nr:class I SAM-dependent methyltransferase [Kofleriaceae bacterium]